jgi:hypothetical protein
MAETPKLDALKLDPKAPRKPKLRYQDRPEIAETFADSIRSCVFDGQLGAALKKAGTVDQPARPEQPKK